MWRICVNHIQLWVDVICKLLIETILAIMPTTIQPVINENIVQFSGLGRSQREMSRTIRVSRGAIYKALCYILESSSLIQGLRGHLLQTISLKENRVLLCILMRKSFLSVVRDQGEADQANCMSGQCPHGPGALSSSGISCRTSRPMPQADPCLSPLPPHVGTQAPQLEPSALVLLMSL